VRHNPFRRTDVLVVRRAIHGLMMRRVVVAEDAARVALLEMDFLVDPLRIERRDVNGDGHMQAMTERILQSQA